jgi:hypothetical protein
MLEFDTIRHAVRVRLDFLEEARHHARALLADTDDDYFLGKMNAYKLAVENMEGLLWHIDKLEEEYVLDTQSQD